MTHSNASVGKIMQFFNPFDMSGIFGFAMLMFLIPIIFFVIILIVVLKFATGAGNAVSTFVTSMPSFADASAPSVRSDGADLRTVRLPAKCPSCGADLSTESIDWVGPLEARCSYCGATVRAKFERV
ncbi:MAG: hypothetical protein K9W43_05565 [Candidatus Thorarchaeota archaeon]|nr:hypothetical protein [Candidatus Thorarchaeota archaeon]